MMPLVTCAACRCLKVHTLVWKEECRIMRGNVELLRGGTYYEYSTECHGMPAGRPIGNHGYSQPQFYWHRIVYYLASYTILSGIILYRKGGWRGLPTPESLPARSLCRMWRGSVIRVSENTLSAEKVHFVGCRERVPFFFLFFFSNIFCLVEWLAGFTSSRVS